MFRVTLPCSGKFTDEVDVSVIINITGFVPVDESIVGAADSLPIGSSSADDEDELEQNPAAAAAASAAAAAGEPAVRTAATTGGEDASTSTVASSSSSLSTQSQPSSAGNSSAATTTAAAGTDEASASSRNLMQSDQEDSSSSAHLQPTRIVLRPVSHTLNIKRKKICTMHPVPVQPNTYPPTQPTQRPVLPTAPGSSGSGNSISAAKWPAIQSQSADQVVSSFLKKINLLLACAHCWLCPAKIGQRNSSSSNNFDGGKCTCSLHSSRSSSAVVAAGAQIEWETFARPVNLNLLSWRNR